MARYTREQRKYHLQMVRRAMIRVESEGRYPSAENIQNELEVLHIQRFTERYTVHLRDAVLADRAKRIDRGNLSIELAKIEDRFAELKTKLYIVLNSEMSTPKEQIMAAKVIADMEKSLMDIKFDSGAFKRQLGKLDVESPAAILVARIMGHGRSEIPNGSRFISRLRGTDVQDKSLPLPVADSGENTTVSVVPEISQGEPRQVPATP